MTSVDHFQSIICVAYSGNLLLTRANLLTTEDILSASIRVDFFDYMKNKSAMQSIITHGCPYCRFNQVHFAVHSFTRS